MIAFATSLAARKGLKLPRGLKSNGAICRAFLDQHAPARSSGPGEHRPQNGPRPPSEAMVRYARALAEEHGVECPPEITDFTPAGLFSTNIHRRHSILKKRTGLSLQKATVQPSVRATAMLDRSECQRP